MFCVSWNFHCKYQHIGFLKCSMIPGSCWLESVWCSLGSVLPTSWAPAVTFTIMLILLSVCFLPWSGSLRWVCPLGCLVISEFLGLWASWLPCLQSLNSWRPPGIPPHCSSKMLILVLTPACSDESMSCWRAHNQLWLGHWLIDTPRDTDAQAHHYL